MSSHPILRGMHDIGLAAWTGGSLNGVVGLNGAAASLDDPRERARASTRGWSRWAPVQGAALAAHYVGGAGLLLTDMPRVRSQRGVARSTAIKLGLEAAGLGVNAWSGVLNRKMAAAGPVPVQGATEPGAGTPADVAATQRQLKLVQWLNPLVGAALIATTSWQGEQQRTTEVVKGVLDRAPGGRRAVIGLATVAGLGLLASRRRKSASATKETTSTTTVTQPYVQDATPVTSATSSSSTASTTGLGTATTGMGTGTTGTGTGAGTAGGFSTGMADSDTMSTGTTGGGFSTGMSGTGTGLGTGMGASDLDDLSTTSTSTTDVTASDLTATDMTDDDALAIESDVEVIDLNEAEGATKTSRVIAGPDA